ncbi:MAG: putative peptidase [Rhodospirillaceae bacterium]|nr:MAG: putative peptidase [Rhodospirillaceae bacterium]
MSGEPFEIAFAALPRRTVIFPLAGVLLLPGGRLPLNVFEPRYLTMTLDALGSGRMIGMVQPRPEKRGTQGIEDSRVETLPRVYDQGCIGRIVSFNETEDGRLLITLVGVCRFRIQRELAVAPGGYRQVEVDYDPFQADMEEPARTTAIDRKRLLTCLKPYFTQHHITLNWKILDGFSDIALVTAIAMLCPFDVREKQALLEVPTVEERWQLLIALIEMDLLHAGGGGTTQ